jgi:hypothetical protein
MAIDDQVAIMGNGNMDGQSWFHSQVNKRIGFLNIYFKSIFIIGDQCYD